MNTTILKQPKSILFIFNTLLLVFMSYFSSAQNGVGVNTSTPKSNFEVNGSVGQKVNIITASTTLDATHNIILCNNTSGAITVTLPDVTTCTGRVYTIKREATSTANVTVAGTIDGVTNIVITNAKEAVILVSNGTQWITVSNNNSPSPTSWSVSGNAGTSSATNYIGTSDATDLVLKTNATSRVTVSSAGVTTIGGATDHLKVEADGTLLLEGAATVWDDIMIFPDATTRGGSNSPAWGGSSPAAFKKNAGATSQGVFLNMFSATTEQELYFVVQMPHKYKVGTTLYPHVHWTTVTGTPTGTNVVWGLEYTVTAFGGSYPNTTTLTANSVIAPIGTPTGTGQHLITSLGTINGSGIGISTILVCRIYRVAADGGDTFANETGLLGIDFHYEIDTEGSRTEFVK